MVTIGEIFKEPYSLIIVFFLGILGSWIIYTLTRKKREICYSIMERYLIVDYVSRIEDLEIIYRGEQIENLLATRILFWNRGGKTIRKSDIAERDLIKIRFEEGSKVLDASKLFETSDINDISVRVLENDRTVELTFDFIAKNDGGVIEILTAGRSETIELLGTVMDEKKDFFETEVEEVIFTKKEKIKSYLSPIFNTLVGLMFLMFIIIVFSLGNVEDSSLIVFFIVISILGITALISGFKALNDIRKSSLPTTFKGVERFF